MKQRPCKVLGAYIITSLVLVGCVTSRIDRVGRAQLVPGSEGYVPVITDTASYVAVATITVDAQVVQTTERRERHLQRRASLMGCDAIAAIQHRRDGASTALCLTGGPAEIVAQTARAPSATLLAELAQAGSAGEALRAALTQARLDDRTYAAWPLRWYTEHYPTSPWREDVSALFAPAAAGTSSVLRAAPQER